MRRSPRGISLWRHHGLTSPVACSPAPPMNRFARFALLILASVPAPALVACSDEPLLADVVDQARAGGKVAYDVVTIDPAVVETVQARRPPPFRERFKAHR